MIGYDWFTGQDVVWRWHHGALIPLTMPHAIEPMSVSKIRRMVVSRRAIFVRWEEVFDRQRDGEWWHVIKDESEKLTELPKKTRWQIRRGWQRYKALPLQHRVILNEGFEVYRAAFDRYEMFETMLSEEEFCHAIEMLPAETEFWGVRDRESGDLVAFSENLVRDDACFYDSIWFEPKALKAYAGYVLIHEMNKHYLTERELSYVSDGARNISHETGIHEFLEKKFKFRRAHAQLYVVYFPGIGMAVGLLFPFRNLFNRGSSGLARKVAVVLEQERIRRSCLESNESW